MELNLPPWFRAVFKLARGAVGAGLLAFAVWMAVTGEWQIAIGVLILTPFVLGFFEAVFLVWPGSAWLWFRNRRRRH